MGPGRNTPPEYGPRSPESSCPMSFTNNPIDTVTLSDRGHFEFDTESGSTYLLDNDGDQPTLTRRPGMHAPAPGQCLRSFAAPRTC